MTSTRLRVLYVSDLAYQARGRRYCDEDIYLTSQLRKYFDLAVCHPLDAQALMDGFDVVAVRNSGPVLYYRAQHEAFRAAATDAGIPVFTELTGKGDMAGKQYLLDLFAAGYPVISTIDRITDLDRLPDTDVYVAKPKFGADSVGLTFVPRADLDRLDYTDLLVQPRIDFLYEVSFYFVGREFQYALYAPDPDQRWVLEPYEPTDADLAFAQRFVDWNDVRHGIQRVDACRTQDGALLLVELEDLNPYLSLDRISPAVRDRFVQAMKTSLIQIAKTRIR
ncbi:hypothetical protein [Catellatospora sichuanensis]|uniref:hypothetical protein n=1 Tax=Catellatospora sichuanensis TaxID=1969805 RepID=UPI001C92B895|nr:hypothetical protein [Catellatospora sichuanensis]